MPHRNSGTHTKKPKSRSGKQKPSELKINSSRAVVGSSSKARPSPGQITKQATSRTIRRPESDEKRAYDNFFTYLPLNAWLYDPRRGSVPSFPQTDEEIKQLVREPTQSDIDSLAADIAAGRVKVDI